MLAIALELVLLFRSHCNGLDVSSVAVPNDINVSLGDCIAAVDWDDDDDDDDTTVDTGITVAIGSLTNSTAVPSPPSFLSNWFFMLCFVASLAISCG